MPTFSWSAFCAFRFSAFNNATLLYFRVYVLSKRWKNIRPPKILPPEITGVGRQCSVHGFGIHCTVDMTLCVFTGACNALLNFGKLAKNSYYLDTTQVTFPVWGFHASLHVFQTAVAKLELKCHLWKKNISNLRKLRKAIQWTKIFNVFKSK